MTATPETAVNGAAPAPPGEPDGQAPARDPGELALGVFGLALALVVGGIALDMLTGHQFGLSRVLALFARGQEDGDGEHG